MKKLIILTLFLSCLNLFSQNKKNLKSINDNQYNINTKIRITQINLSIHYCAIYLKDSIDKNGKAIIQRIPKSVTLERINDNESCFYLNYYDYNSEPDTLDVHFKDRVKFKTKTFDELVKKLNTIKIEKIKENGGVTFDGCSYRISFSNEIYKISISADNPEINTKKRNLRTFLKVCKMISVITSYY